MSPTREAFFLTADAGRSGERFCLFHPASGSVPRGAVLYVHPLAEEMNKSRRMAALQARALADAGFSVLQIDLLGCGDSSGDFGDASWADWVGDVQQGLRWLARRHPESPLWLWGLRAGALLACEAGRSAPQPVNFLFWQPATAGKLLLQQFLRMKAAGSLADGNAKAVMEQARAALSAGEPVHVGGYWLSAKLAQGLEAASTAPPAHRSRVVWLELASRNDAGLSPAAASTIVRWQEAGHEVHAAAVTGPAFWQTTEIEDAPALIPATLAALTEPVVA